MTCFLRQPFHPFLLQAPGLHNFYCLQHPGYKILLTSYYCMYRDLKLLFNLFPSSLCPDNFIDFIITEGTFLDVNIKIWFGYVCFYPLSFFILRPDL